VEEAIDLFREMPKITESLGLMKEIGLGYLRLGQPATTLSGGEAQRLKICAEMPNAESAALHKRAKMRGFLYILDEPTVGLHHMDVHALLGVLQRLVDSGNTVLVIEHNLDVVRKADWIIDLGPEGGDEGGRIVFAGTPEDILSVEGSHTGRYLREYLREHGCRGV
jgi:excinuclease ABC subunit A